MKLVNFIVAFVIVIVSAVLCYQIVSNSRENQKNKADYAELNHVKYGLLSIDEWKRQITVILTDKIDQLSLSKTNERDLRRHVESLLNTLIDQVDKKIRKDNKGSVGGWAKQSIINMLVDLDDIKKGIPEYTDAIMQEMDKSKAEGQIKTLLNKQLKQYLSQTYDTQNTSRMQQILARTHAGNIEAARAQINQDVLVKQALIAKETMLLILLSVILFAWSGFSKQALTPSRHILLVVSLVILLVAGVTTPTIDMEAKISQMSFMLMGHVIHFDNQVLYFQSKSIVDVFWIMITHQDIQMKFVGVLLVTFSILFPLLKIALSPGYYHDYHHARNSRIIEFFALKSGKWSMADVMVISIFMAYIGFNGMIAGQFGQLNSAGQDLVILSTNGTSLQPGYYLFLTYTLLALFLSGMLAKKPIF